MISSSDADKLNRSSAINRRVSLGTVLQQAETDSATVAEHAIAKAKLVRGYAGKATLSLAGGIPHQSTIIIGADKYEFLDTATGVNLAADANIGVAIGADAAATYANLLAAINGTAARRHATILKKSPSREHADGLGTELVTASIATNVLTVYQSTAQGNAVPGGTESIALSTTGLTDTPSWSYANLNLAGALPAERSLVTGKITITAAMVTAKAFSVVLPFTPTVLVTTLYNSAGTPRAFAGNDTLKINGAGLDLVLDVDGAGAGETALAAGDVIHFVAIA